MKISPSILNSDLAHLADQIELIADADRVHVDVMDGHFVPNLSWGTPIVEAVVRSSSIPVDAHLMIDDPDRWALDYIEAGAELVTFHWEAAIAPIRLARAIRAAGGKAGVAIRPGTPVEPILDHLDEFDLVLVMTVEPGFGGQKLIPATLSKVSKLREAALQADLPLEIQVDGGINRETIELAAAAGASNFVVGSALYGSDNPTEEVSVLREKADNAH